VTEDCRQLQLKMTNRQQKIAEISAAAAGVVVVAGHVEVLVISQQAFRNVYRCPCGRVGIALRKRSKVEEGKEKEKKEDQWSYLVVAP